MSYAHRKLHLCLVIPSHLLLAGFLNKTLEAHLFSPHVLCAAHFIFSHLMTQLIFGRKHKSRSSSKVISCNVLLLSLPQYLILNILSLCYSHNVTDQVSYPYYSSRQTYSTVYCNFYTQSDSYRTPGMFLPIILEQMTGSRRNLPQKHCLFMPVLCMNNAATSTDGAEWHASLLH